MSKLELWEDFSEGDPTARADALASDMRDYFERHRETWWDRWTKPWKTKCDNLMLGLQNIVRVHERRRHEQFVNNVHRLIVSMVEVHGYEHLAGTSWYGQDFIHVVKDLEARGRICRPK